LALLASCAPTQYAYRPAAQVTATVSGLPAGRYPIPPERPLGTVLVASPGIATMSFQGDADANMISVRLVVENNTDDQPWQVDTREQRVIFGGGGESTPAYVNTNGESSPVLQVVRGKKVSIDLFYPLPGNAGAEQVPEFDFFWQVHTGQRLVAERSAFDRTKVEPVYAQDYYYGWGYEPYWWYDPFWPGPTYVIGGGFHHYHGAPAYVRPFGGPRGVPPAARRVR
jgi:hypothetical protein